jgi:serine/threonine-protein kinase
MGDSAPNLVRTIGRYSLFDEIASGGMATVYLGRLAGSGGFARTVAIKSLHAHLAKDPEFVSMFLDEARLAARIRHPNVVPTLDVVASKGEVFLVMEYVQGESLSRLARLQWHRADRIPLPVLLRIMSDVLQGLHAAHEARDDHGVPLEIVHRDVSPQNVLVGVDGVARLLDFGVAKAAGRATTTRDGSIKGKLAYMAPEQLSNMGVTRQTDVYAAAVVLWEMLTGERLFRGETELDLVGKLIKREIRPPRELAPYIPRALDEVVMKGLSPRLDERYATARAMCADLARCGVPEAPAMAVAEWVEALAVDALAERSAKIAAIASLPRGVVAFSPASSFPPAMHPTVPQLRAATPLAVPFTAAAPSVERPLFVDPNEPRSDVVSVSVNTAAVRRGSRRRMWAAAGALSLLLVPAAFALVRVVPQAPRSGAASQAKVPVPAFEPASPVTAEIPSPPPPAFTDDSHPRAASPVASVSVPLPVRPAAPSTVQRAAPRPVAPSVRAPQRAGDGVFDSRE